MSRLAVGEDVAGDCLGSVHAGSGGVGGEFVGVLEFEGFDVYGAGFVQVDHFGVLACFRHFAWVGVPVVAVLGGVVDMSGV